MGKAAATMALGQAIGLEAGIDERRGHTVAGGRPRRSRIAAAWRDRRELDRQRADLSKSPNAGLGRDTGCRV